MSCKLKNKIADYRAKRRSGPITKAHLSRQLRVSRSYVTRLEKGEVSPSAEIMFKLAEYFDCQINELFQIDATPVKKSAMSVATVATRGGNK